MTTTEIVLACVSVVSLFMVIVLFVRIEILKAKEKANMAILVDRLGSVHSGVEVVYGLSNMLVQLPKYRNTSVQTLQDDARVLRKEIFFLARSVRDTQEKLNRWRSGRHLKCEPGEALGEHEAEGETARQKEAGPEHWTQP